MTEGTADVSRRAFLRTAAGATTATAATGVAAAQEGNESSGGEGGGHNVVSDSDGPLDSGNPVDTSGVEYEHTFEEDGIYKYYCAPHKSLGMKGAVVVGSDYPTAGSGGEGGGGGGSGGVPDVPESVKSLGIASSVVMSATLGLAYVFMKYGGDYGTPE